MGSSEAVTQWITNGYLDGQPLQSAIFFVAFFVAGAWQLITGGPF